MVDVGSKRHMVRSVTVAVLFSHTRRMTRAVAQHNVAPGG